jgi:hypothetical protein
MSARNRRAAAAALIGVLVSGVPVAAASADAQHGGSAAPGSGGSGHGTPHAVTGWTPPDPGGPGAGGPIPQVVPPAGGSVPPNITPVVTPPAVTPPVVTLPPSAAGDPPSACGQITFTVPIPAVITCGPVTITFNTVTTTNTTTTVAAPITAANGSITGGVAGRAPSLALRNSRIARGTRHKRHRAGARARRHASLVARKAGRRAPSGRSHLASHAGR